MTTSELHNVKYNLDGLNSSDMLLSWNCCLRLKLKTEVGSACRSCKEDSKPFNAAFLAATLQANSFNIKEKKVIEKMESH